MALFVLTFHDAASKLYALMISGVVPRPIALVSTVSQEGVENLAPFRQVRYCYASYSPV